MGFRKTAATGKITEVEGDDRIAKTASADDKEWQPRDDRELQAENAEADGEQ